VVGTPRGTRSRLDFPRVRAGVRCDRVLEFAALGIGQAVAFLAGVALDLGRILLAAMARSQARKLVPGVNSAMRRKANTNVSWVISSTSLRHGQLEGDKRVNRIQMPLDERLEAVDVPGWTAATRRSSRSGSRRWRRGRHVCLSSPL